MEDGSGNYFQIDGDMRQPLNKSRVEALLKSARSTPPRTNTPHQSSTDLRTSVVVVTEPHRKVSDPGRIEESPIFHGTRTPHASAKQPSTFGDALSQSRLSPPKVFVAHFMPMSRFARGNPTFETQFRNRLGAPAIEQGHDHGWTQPCLVHKVAKAKIIRMVLGRHGRHDRQGMVLLQPRENFALQRKLSCL